MTMLRASPYIPVKDVEASIAFYERALGFEARMRDGSPTSFAIIGKDDVTLTLTLDRAGELAGKVATYITVDGVDSFYRRCLEAGADMDSDLGVRPYGMKDFAVHDLDENHVFIGERIET
jgi:uncharacterized glyoxalase superfamily protein PhnB